MSLRHAAVTSCVVISLLHTTPPQHTPGAPYLPRHHTHSLYKTHNATCQANTTSSLKSPSNVNKQSRGQRQQHSTFVPHLHTTMSLSSPPPPRCTLPPPAHTSHTQVTITYFRPLPTTQSLSRAVLSPSAQYTRAKRKRLIPLYSYLSEKQRRLSCREVEPMPSVEVVKEAFRSMRVSMGGTSRT